MCLLFVGVGDEFFVGGVVGFRFVLFAFSVYGFLFVYCVDLYYYRV